MSENTDTPDTPEVADYFAIAKSLTAYEKLQLIKRLDVEEYQLGRPGTAQLIAVAWKHKKTTTGKAPNIVRLLNLTEDELYAEMGLTAEQIAEQMVAKLGRLTDEDDDEGEDDVDPSKS